METTAAGRHDVKCQPRNDLVFAKPKEPKLPERIYMNSITPKIAQVIARVIRNRVILRELKPGDNLPLESDLAKDFGVSRPTVREAIRILENEGLLKVRQGGRFGAIVTAPDVSVCAQRLATQIQYEDATVSDVWEAWHAIQLVAIVKLTTNPERYDFSELQKIVDSLFLALETRERFAALGMAIGNEMVRMAGNTVLSVLSSLLENIVLAQNLAVRAKADPDAMRNVRIEYATIIRSMVEKIERGDMSVIGEWSRFLEEVRSRALHIIGPTSIVDLLHRSELQLASDRIV